MSKRETFVERNIHMVWLFFTIVIGCIVEFGFGAKGMTSLYIGVPGGLILTFIVAMIKMK